jgi:hypothetical protein
MVCGPPVGHPPRRTNREPSRRDAASIGRRRSTGPTGVCANFHRRSRSTGWRRGSCAQPHSSRASGSRQAAPSSPSGAYRRAPEPVCHESSATLTCVRPPCVPVLCSRRAGPRNEPEAAGPGGEAVPGSALATSVHVAASGSPPPLEGHPGAVLAIGGRRRSGRVRTLPGQHRPLTIPSAASGVASYLIVDDQQGLTTLMLILCAIRDAAAKRMPRRSSATTSCT